MRESPCCFGPFKYPAYQHLSYSRALTQWRNRHRAHQRHIGVDLGADTTDDLTVVDGQQVGGQMLAGAIERQPVFLQQ